MKTKISALSEDLIEEIFSRVPVTSLGAVRSTCKPWEALSRNQIVGQKAARKNQFLELMIIDFRVCSLRFDLQGVRNDKDERHFTDPSMKQINIPNHQVEVSKVYHCDGLLLCVTIDKEDHSSSLLVWNPYMGQTRLIQTRNKFYRLDAYAIGYDKNKKRNHKILRIFDGYDDKKKVAEVYDFSSDSWRVLDLSPVVLEELYDYEGVSLKGDTYFFREEETEDYLTCFDFSRERFGPCLPLPFQPAYLGLETGTRSWVRDEKLVVLHHHDDMPEIIEIWITTEIEHSAVSWSSFFKLDMRLTNGLPDGFPNDRGPMSFFIDEEKKVALLFYLERHTSQTESYNDQMVYIFGEDGYLRSVNIGPVPVPPWDLHKLVCSSYVPSLVQLQV